jgi:hypothetical protein
MQSRRRIKTEAAAIADNDRIKAALVQLAAKAKAASEETIRLAALLEAGSLPRSAFADVMKAYAEAAEAGNATNKVLGCICDGVYVCYEKAVDAYNEAGETSNAAQRRVSETVKDLKDKTALNLATDVVQAEAAMEAFTRAFVRAKKLEAVKDHCSRIMACYDEVEFEMMEKAIKKDVYAAANVKIVADCIAHARQRRQLSLSE